MQKGYRVRERTVKKSRLTGPDFFCEGLCDIIAKKCRTEVRQKYIGKRRGIQ